MEVLSNVTLMYFPRGVITLDPSLFSGCVCNWKQFKQSATIIILRHQPVSDDCLFLCLFLVECSVFETWEGLLYVLARLCSNNIWLWHRFNWELIKTLAIRKGQGKLPLSCKERGRWPPLDFLDGTLRK